MMREDFTMTDKNVFLEAAKDLDTEFLTSKQIHAIVADKGIKFPHWFIRENKVGYNKYAIDAAGLKVVSNNPAPQPVTDAKIVTQAKLAIEVDNLIPVADPTYVAFGFHTDLNKIIRSGLFYPTFISGLSGNGKTTMVEQVCAKAKREAIRVNISVETDEDDLIGGNTLVDGNVVYREGPVLTAMKRGAVLILDEIDRGSNKLMCLQAILEGKPYFNKKTGEVIAPASGFNIIATANTKGRGSDDGKFISAQILDEAFLERFAVTIEQQYPTETQEKKIVLGKMSKVGKVDEDFAEKLVRWADVIRKTFNEGAIDDLVSTRRLEHIVNAFAMFDNRLKAIELCVNRFDEDTRQAFLDLYTKVDAGVELTDQQETIENNEEETEIDF
ncbi:MoxR family ATPase [bacterium]|nr:MoxR family ATPase [bacterium]